MNALTTNKIAIFLDLEKTVIDSWDSGKLLESNIAKITRHVRTLNSLTDTKLDLGIFSFAIWNDNDRIEFIEKMLPAIEEVIRIDVNQDLIPSIADLVQHIKKKQNLSVFDHNEFFNFFNKKSAFLAWGEQFVKASAEQPPQFKMIELIDDMVDNSIMHLMSKPFADTDTTVVSTININDM